MAPFQGGQLCFIIRCDGIFFDASHEWEIDRWRGSLDMILCSSRIDWLLKVDFISFWFAFSFCVIGSNVSFIIKFMI